VSRAVAVWTGAVWTGAVWTGAVWAVIVLFIVTESFSLDGLPSPLIVT
jgi:hypothetical protein